MEKQFNGRLHVTVVREVVHVYPQPTDNSSESTHKPDAGKRLFQALSLTAVGLFGLLFLSLVTPNCNEDKQQAIQTSQTTQQTTTYPFGESAGQMQELHSITTVGPVNSADAAAAKQAADRPKAGCSCLQKAMALMNDEKAPFHYVGKISVFILACFFAIGAASMAIMLAKLFGFDFFENLEKIKSWLDAAGGKEGAAGKMLALGLLGGVATSVVAVPAAIALQTPGRADIPVGVNVSGGGAVPVGAQVSGGGTVPIVLQPSGQASIPLTLDVTVKGMNDFAAGMSKFEEGISNQLTESQTLLGEMKATLGQSPASRNVPDDLTNTVNKLLYITAWQAVENARDMDRFKESESLLLTTLFHISTLEKDKLSFGATQTPDEFRQHCQPILNGGSLSKEDKEFWQAVTKSPKLPPYAPAPDLKEANLKNFCQLIDFKS